MTEVIESWIRSEEEGRAPHHLPAIQMAVVQENFSDIVGAFMRGSARTERNARRQGRQPVREVLCVRTLF